MKPLHALYVSVGALATCVALLWCMNVSFLPWIGVYLTQGSPYVGGIALAAGLMFLLTWFYGRVLMKNDKSKKFPGFVLGLAYGLVLAAIFIFIIPPVLGALTGNPNVHQSENGFVDAFNAVGHRIFPAPPDLGFAPPMRSLSDKPWWNVADWQGRIVPFGIAFVAAGLVIGLFSAGKGGKSE
ncbi:MAG: hypothetical protein IT462_04320 [Planctomycetes bacterium]|nr:hypothetical protein [Planctomycetota bacterium]